MERTGYAGLQITFAFFYSVFQGSAPDTNLNNVRNRVVGILCGLLVTPYLNALNFASVHSNRCPGHPPCGGRYHEREQVGYLFRLSVATDLRFFWKLFHCFFDTHVVRWRPLLHEGASSCGHHRTRDNAIDLHSVLNALFGERFREGNNGGIYRGYRCESRLRVESSTTRHKYDRPLGLLKRFPCAYR